MGGKIGAGVRVIFFAVAILISTGLIDFKAEEPLSKVELNVEYDEEEELDSFEDSAIEKPIIEDEMENQEAELGDEIIDEKPEELEAEPERLEPEIIDNSEVEDLELKLIPEAVEEKKEGGDSIGSMNKDEEKLDMD